MSGQSCSCWSPAGCRCVSGSSHARRCTASRTSARPPGLTPTDLCCCHRCCCCCCCFGSGGSCTSGEVQAAEAAGDWCALMAPPRPPCAPAPPRCGFYDTGAVQQFIKLNPKKFAKYMNGKAPSFGKAVKGGANSAKFFMEQARGLHRAGLHRPAGTRQRCPRRLCATGVSRSGPRWPPAAAVCWLPCAPQSPPPAPSQGQAWVRSQPICARPLWIHRATDCGSGRVCCRRPEWCQLGSVRAVHPQHRDSRLRVRMAWAAPCLGVNRRFPAAPPSTASARPHTPVRARLRRTGDALMGSLATSKFVIDAASTGFGAAGAVCQQRVGAAAGSAARSACTGPRTAAALRSKAAGCAHSSCIRCIRCIEWTHRWSSLACSRPPRSRDGRGGRPRGHGGWCGAGVPADLVWGDCRPDRPPGEPAAHRQASRGPGGCAAPQKSAAGSRAWCHACQVPEAAPGQCLGPTLGCGSRCMHSVPSQSPRSCPACPPARRSSLHRLHGAPRTTPACATTRPTPSAMSGCAVRGVSTHGSRACRTLMSVRLSANAESGDTCRPMRQPALVCICRRPTRPASTHSRHSAARGRVSGAGLGVRPPTTASGGCRAPGLAAGRPNSGACLAPLALCAGDPPRAALPQLLRVQLLPHDSTGVRVWAAWPPHRQQSGVAVGAQHTVLSGGALLCALLCTCCAPPPAVSRHRKPSLLPHGGGSRPSTQASARISRLAPRSCTSNHPPVECRDGVDHEFWLFSEGCEKGDPFDVWAYKCSNVTEGCWRQQARACSAQGGAPWRTRPAAHQPPLLGMGWSQSGQAKRHPVTQRWLTPPSCPCAAPQRWHPSDPSVVRQHGLPLPQRVPRLPARLRQ